MTNTNQEARPLARRDELIVEELEGELVVYDLRTHRVCCLNATATLVWSLSDGTRTVPELAVALAGATGLPEDSELVLLCLTRLRAVRLLEQADQFPRVTRRQVIRQLALNSALAALLPVITAVSAQAQANLGSCVRAAFCILPRHSCSPCHIGAQPNANQCRNRRCFNSACRLRTQTPCA